MCPKCHKSHTTFTDKAFVAKARDPSPNEWRVDELYFENAPPESIAFGADFGSFRKTKELGVPTTCSELEALVLGTGRLYAVTVKLMAFGAETKRQRLLGHTIIFPQKYMPIGDGIPFGAAAVAGALEHVRVVLVGPVHMQRRLEMAALNSRPLGLRVDVLYNQLVIKHQLQGGPAPPTPTEVQAALDSSPLHAHIHLRARRVIDTTLDGKNQPSDIGNVRTRASNPRREGTWPGGGAGDGGVDGGEEGAEDPSPMEEDGDTPPADDESEYGGEEVLEEDSGLPTADDESPPPSPVPPPSPGPPSPPPSSPPFPPSELGSGIEPGEQDEPVPNLVPVGVFPNHREDMATVFSSIEAALLNPPDEEAGGALPRGNIEVGTSSRPLNDYGDGGLAIYATWDSLFPLKRGLGTGRVADCKYRHLFLYYDNRFAHSMSLLFYCADVLMRHATNKSIGVKVKTSPGAFQAFHASVSSSTFFARLEQAKADPKVHTFPSSPSSSVFFSSSSSSFFSFPPPLLPPPTPPLPPFLLKIFLL
jgi:hypothetical protein